MKIIFIQLVKLYQKTLSPDHGWLKYKYPHGFCRFYPSCSQYAIEALGQHGTFKGLFLSVQRVLRCNPFSAPRVDSVPKIN